MREIDARSVYLKMTPWNALIAMVNNKYRLDLRGDTTRIVEFTPMDGTRTAVRLASNRSTGSNNQLLPFTERTFHYDRIDLGEFFNNTPIVINTLRPPLTTNALTRWLANQHGFVYSTDDFINDVINTDAELNGYVLEANPKSLRWVGSVTITTQDNTINLNGLTNVNLTHSLTHGQSDPAKIDGSMFLSGYDFTQYRSELLTLKPGNNAINHKRLSLILNRITEFKQTWRCAGELTSWNIGVGLVNDIPRYNVLYNGPTGGSSWSSRGDMRNVLVIELSNTLCSNIEGFILLHYN